MLFQLYQESRVNMSCHLTYKKQSLVYTQCKFYNAMTGQSENDLKSARTNQFTAHTSRIV